MTSKGRRSRASPKIGATISDVARRAGVSTATVSRALATPDRVAAETRAKVAAAVAETGYTPNAAARNLRARSTRIVLALMPGMSNTFFNPILNAIEETLSAAGYGMIIGDTRNSAAREAHYARLIRAGQVDGLILFTGHLPRGEDGSVDVGNLPIALICNEIPGDSDHSVFDVDNRLAAKKAVGYLIAAGHRRIGFIGGPEGNVEAVERRRGYLEALSTAGLPAEESLIWPGNFQFEAGRRSGSTPAGARSAPDRGLRVGGRIGDRPHQDASRRGRPHAGRHLGRRLRRSRLCQRHRSAPDDDPPAARGPRPRGGRRSPQPDDRRRDGPAADPPPAAVQAGRSRERPPGQRRTRTRLIRL